LREAADYAYG